MVRRRRVLAALGTGAFGGMAGCAEQESSSTPQAFQFSIPALADGDIPRRLTCDGDGTTPRIEVDRVPQPTDSLALVFAFPDDVASQQTLWTMWDIPADTAEIPADVPSESTVPALDGAKQGRNAAGDVGYLPVCPPHGKAYEHWFTLYALRRPLGLEAGATRDAVDEELETATLASSLVRANYRRTEPTAD